jgi:dTDP-4-dehydrorhamnose 3,5-epimerase
MKFLFLPTGLEGVTLVKCEQFQDSRGSFSEVYKKDIFLENGIGPFVQENYSCSVKNVIRGLHYQSHPRAIGKLVSCPHGKIFDVAVDIRKESSTFGRWTAVVLDNGDATLWIPPGFAHGFAVLSDTANVLYRQTEYYSKENDCNIRWSDPEIDIIWPIDRPLVSSKDKEAPFLKEAILL